MKSGLHTIQLGWSLTSGKGSGKLHGGAKEIGSRVGRPRLKNKGSRHAIIHTRNYSIILVKGSSSIKEDLSYSCTK
jgi:hypothetical protein